MPRINPQSLLKCLHVLLNQDGGIRGSAEVKRMIALMKKFSNTLVSKVCYTLILKETKDELLSEYMSEGGWTLVFSWLGDAIIAENSPFIKEVLQLLIKCPISLERLKESNAPRTIKGLSKESDDPSVRDLARQLVEMWLEFIKSGRAAVEPPPSPTTAVVPPAEEEAAPAVAAEEEVSPSSESEEPATETLQPFKIVVRDGKRVLVMPGPDGATAPKVQRVERVSDIARDKPVKVRETVVRSLDESINSKVKAILRADKSKEHDRRREIEKDRRERKEKLQKSTLKSSLNILKKQPEKEKIKERRAAHDAKIRDKFHVLQKSRLEKEKERKGERERKLSASDLDDMPPRKTPAISSLGKIPKKSAAQSETISAAEATATGGVLGGTRTTTAPAAPAPVKEPVPLPTAKKGSYSDERKRTAELKPSERPKTVKTAPTKFRSTGLEEEAKPPVPRSSVKTKEKENKERESSGSHKSRDKDRESSGKDKESSKKHGSSPKESKDSPQEKKSRSSESKINEVKEKIEKKAEKPSGIKLIPPKPKPVLLESDLFSDALTASTKNEPRKKKRRPSSSSSKDSDEKKKDDKEESSSSGSRHSKREKRDKEKESEKSPPREKRPRFYRDTMEDSEAKKESSEESEETEPSRPKLYPEGVLVLLRSSKAPKKSVKWRGESELVSVKTFELDENERVNVSRQNFMDMKAMDRTQEREALMMHKMGTEETGIDRMPWGPLMIVDVPADKQAPAPGQNSNEKEVQEARQRSVLAAIFFSKSMIPDSPKEPDQEYHPMTDPKQIPLEDTAASADANFDYSATGWAEPKPEEKLEPQGNVLQQYPGYSTFPQYSMAPNSETWMDRKDGGVNGMTYPPNGVVPPIYNMPGYSTGQGPADGYSMPMYPNAGYTMPPPAGIYGPMGPPPPMWGGWTGPRPPPMALDTRNICRVFSTTGNCKFGPKCRFLHPGVNCPPLPS